MAATSDRRRRTPTVAAEYTEEDVTRGLVSLVWHQGSSSRAKAALKAQYDLDVPVATLNTWRDKTHAERYAQLRFDAQYEIEQEAIRTMRDHMTLAAEAERLAIEATIEGLKKGTLDRPDQAANNLSKVKATNAEKLMTMTGRPATITENRSVEQLLRVLASKNVLALPEPAIDAVAVDA